MELLRTLIIPYLVNSVIKGGVSLGIIDLAFRISLADEGASYSERIL